MIVTRLSPKLAMVRFNFTSPSRMNMHLLIWLRLWIRNPLKLGAIAPSSRDLAMAMARLVPPNAKGPVVELGGGTGVVTRALIETGVETGDLIVIERDPTLYALLQKRFPQVRVVLGDATELSRLLAPLGLGPVRAVVSGLPLLSMSKEAQQRIVQEAFAVMAKDGPMIQFTYGPFSPIARRRLGLAGRVAERVFANLPPASVWEYWQSRPV
jgi:phosphatidylethanolamine/phosphatidyl-N-methylethanolamine N-methyltransferase